MQRASARESPDLKRSASLCIDGVSGRAVDSSMQAKLPRMIRPGKKWNGKRPPREPPEWPSALLPSEYAADRRGAQLFRAHDGHVRHDRGIHVGTSSGFHQTQAGSTGRRIRTQRDVR